jgi:hypothetical protein
MREAGRAGEGVERRALPTSPSYTQRTRGAAQAQVAVAVER